MWLPSDSAMAFNTKSKSFSRYFRDEGLRSVTNIFEDIMETMGFMYGFASDPDYKPGECNMRPEVLPVKVYYQYVRTAQEGECDTPGWTAYVDTLPPDGLSPDPGSRHVKPYIVVCPRLFDLTDPEPLYHPRMLTDQGDIRWPGTYATYVGEGGNLYPKSGLWSAGASLAHEIMHLDNIHTERTGTLSVIDNKLGPNGWKKTITAYTGWQCQELRRVAPEEAHLNANNYIFFALEEWWTEHLPKRSQPWTSSVDFTDAPVGYPEENWPEEHVPQDGMQTNG